MANLTKVEVGKPEWELLHDQLEGTYAIRRVDWMLNEREVDQTNQKEPS